MPLLTFTFIHSAMPKARILQKLHFISTLWFALCVIFIVALSLYQAGYSWFVIFSLSGYSVALLYPILAFYILAIFKGAARSQEPEVEHPLSCTLAYNVFYSLSPLLGALAGLLTWSEGISRSEFLLNLANATLVVTFVIWIFVDPMVSMVENSIPTARRHRLERLEQERLEQERLEQERQEMLKEVRQKEQQEKEQLKILLTPHASQLGTLLQADIAGFDAEETVVMEATRLGLLAWQNGGLDSMKTLRDMALAACPQVPAGSCLSYADKVSIWWDGIGDWKHAPLSICPA